jgi:hypothetical protein
MEWLKSRLIDDWQRAWRFASVRLQVAAIAFLALYELVPAVPQEISALIPSAWRGPLLGCYAVLGIVARLMRKKSGG